MEDKVLVSMNEFIHLVIKIYEIGEVFHDKI